MMWNYLVSGLLVDSTIVLYDGSPAHPDLGALWRLADEEEVSYFGTSAPYLMACRKAGIRPSAEADLSRIRAIGSTGAPLPAAGFRYVYEAIAPAAQLQSVSGGTDVCTAFLGASPLVPVWEGELSCRHLGCAVEAYSPSGEPLVGEEGELVITAPMPSMPVSFWNDPGGERYRAAYFEDFPGVWRHGDWVTFTERGSCVISGRSDATLNRGGVRIGTAEFYAVVEGDPEIVDSLVVHLDADDRLLLFVALAPEAPLDDALRSRIVERAADGAVAAPRPRRDRGRAEHSRARCPARSWRCRSSVSSAARRPRSPPRANRSPTRARSTHSSPTQPAGRPTDEHGRTFTPGSCGIPMRRPPGSTSLGRGSTRSRSPGRTRCRAGSRSRCGRATTAWWLVAKGSNDRAPTCR